VSYPQLPDYRSIVDEIESLAQLQHDHGAEDLAAPLARAEAALRRAVKAIGELPIDKELAAKEPDRLEEIRALRPRGPRRLWEGFDPDLYAEKVEGALIGRMAGCTLGAPVEGWSVEAMADWAKEIGDPFPPTDYWSRAKMPSDLRYGVSRFDAYTRDGMDGVPADDDIIYTVLGLMILEKHGPSFTTEDVGRMWHSDLNWVYKDMEWPLNRLLAGTPATKAADENPYAELICAFIRCDPYGYLAPGQPERAAALDYRDGFMSHRRNGLYGGMFFSAAISAAFAVDHPAEAIRIGLTEIPKECRLAKEIRWALRASERMRDYRDARRAVDRRFKGMTMVHTINNACLVVFGLMLGGTDFTKVISETVAMGLDNDCTAATAGSIAGAIVGKRGIPERWHHRFNDKIHTYIRGHSLVGIDDLVERYTRQAEALFADGASREQ
jgi:ADP-ribosylglycohydrolase